MKSQAKPSAYRWRMMLLSLALSCNVSARAEQPQPIHPQSLHWQSAPAIPKLQAAWVLGGENVPGPYILRVKLDKDGRIPPHTHPDVRHSTVLSGTLYVGFGTQFDEEKLVAIPSGGVYVAPAKLPHFLWAKDGDVVYQESGVAPTATHISQP